MQPSSPPKENFSRTYGHHTLSMTKGHHTLSKILTFVISDWLDSGLASVVVDGDFAMGVWRDWVLLGVFVMAMRVFLDFSFDFLNFQLRIFSATKHGGDEMWRRFMWQ